MTSSSRTAGHETAVERGCVRSGGHPRVRLPSGPWLLTSWWYMEVENLILEVDARGYFEHMSDLDAFIVVGVDDGDIFYGCAVNPEIDPWREFGALVGVQSSSLGLRTLGSTGPCSRTVGSIAATGDGNYGAGRLSFHLWTEPTTHRQRPQHKGLGGALVAKVTTLRRAKT